MSDDRGTVTAFVVGFMAAVLAVAGLVIDGGRVLASRRHAADVAESAARAGAQEIDIAHVRMSGAVRLDPDRAAERAMEFLEQSGVTGTVKANEQEVTVEVSITTSLFILGFAGIADSEVQATGSARASRGVNGEGS